MPGSDGLGRVESRVHTPRSRTLDLLDPVNGVLAGTARAGTEFSVNIGDPAPDLHERGPIVAVGTDGQWSVDLGAFGFDLEPGMQGWLEVVDPQHSGDTCGTRTHKRQIEPRTFITPGDLAQLVRAKPAIVLGSVTHSEVPFSDTRQHVRYRS